MSQKLISIQLLRFAAALLVVHTHAVNNAVFLTGARPSLVPGRSADLGAIGVDIFFVISGFIIASSVLAAPHPTARSFMRNRLIRIVPLYFLASIPWAAISLSRQGFDAQLLIASLLFWPVTASGFVHPYLEVGWTLCFEMLFYAAVAATLLPWRGRSPRGLLALYGVFLALGLLIDRPLWHYLGNPIILEFLMGVGLCFVLKTQPRRSRLGGAAALSGFFFAMAGFAAFGCAGVGDYMETLDGSRAALRVLLWGVPALLLVYGALQFEGFFAEHKSAPVLALLGEASYAIYLVHQYVAWEINAMIRHFQLAVSGDVIILMIGAASILSGLIVCLAIERPLLRFLRRRPNGAPPRPEIAIVAIAEWLKPF